MGLEVAPPGARALGPSKVAVDGGALRLELRGGGAPGVAGLLVCECEGGREVVWLQEVPEPGTSPAAEGPLEPLEEWAQVRYLAGGYRVRVTAVEAVRSGLAVGARPVAAVASDPGGGALGLRIEAHSDRLRAHEVLEEGRQVLRHLVGQESGDIEDAEGGGVLGVRANVWLSTLRLDTLGLQIGASEDDALDIRLAVTAVSSRGGGGGGGAEHLWSVRVDAMRVDPSGMCEGHASVAATPGTRIAVGDYELKVRRIAGQTLRPRADQGGRPVLAPDGGAVHESEYALPLVHVLLGVRRMSPSSLAAEENYEDVWAALLEDLDKPSG